MSEVEIKILQMLQDGILTSAAADELLGALVAKHNGTEPDYEPVAGTVNVTIFPEGENNYWLHVYTATRS